MVYCIAIEYQQLHRPGQFKNPLNFRLNFGYKYTFNYSVIPFARSILHLIQPKLKVAFEFERSTKARFIVGLLSVAFLAKEISADTRVIMILTQEKIF